MEATRHISLPTILTQSYNAGTLKYTETFSIGAVKLSGTKRIRLRNLVNEGFYFKTVNAIDTPVTVAILTSSRRIEDILAAASGFALQADPETGAYTTYTGANPEILRTSNNGVNPFFPHRFAVYNADEAQYAAASAKGLIVEQMTVHDAILTQGTSYNCPYQIEIATQGNYLYLVPFLASLKKTELACASRLSFTLEELPDELVPGDEGGYDA
jgi:hypothetical protein